ncbi:MAG: DUF2971 domain-containing protein [Nocardioides sp.]
MIARNYHQRGKLEMFTDDDVHKYVYHFTRPDTFRSHILPESRLRMSKFSKVNDPRESREWVCNLLVPDKLMDRDWDIVALSERFTAYMKANAKLLCVTRDDPEFHPNRESYLYGRGYAHPSMWDRYADAHSGVCLVLDAEKLAEATNTAAGGRGTLQSQAVSYADQPSGEVNAYTLFGAELVEFGEDATFARHQSHHLDALYFWKSKDWASEFEYRWVLLDSSDDDVYVDIREALSGVIFGDRYPAHGPESAAASLEESDVQLGRLKYRNGHPIVLPHEI